MATIRDIASAVGVSTTTVSRILNNDPHISVSDETRRRIFSVANGMGYRKKWSPPNIESASLLYWVSGRGELEDTYFHSIRVELEAQAKARSISLARYTQEDGIEAVAPNTSAFLAVGYFQKKELARIQSITSHGVFIDTAPDEKHFDSVLPNLPLMIREIVEHFLAMGHKRIGFIGGAGYPPLGIDVREKAFREVAREYGVYRDSSIFIADSFSVSEGYKTALRAIEQYGDELPTAFCVASDALAIGALQAFNEKGWAIPQRISFFSINNISVAKYVSPPLTTFGIDIPLICKTALDLLQDRIATNRAQTKTILISGVPVFRKSVQELPDRQEP